VHRRDRFADYAELVREANAFLSGKSRAVKESSPARWRRRRRARFRARRDLSRPLAALSAVQSRQGINPRTVEEADVFAVHQQGGYSCVEVFFFRTGQNWGNRAYFPRADRSLEAGEVLGAFLAQFYDDKPPPRCVFLSHEIEDRALLSEALGVKSGHKVEVSLPQRGEKKELVDTRSPMRARRSGASSPKRSRSRICSARSARPSGSASRRAASRSTTTATSRAATRSAR
jgi:excinuclease ABC subunit C